MEEEAKSRWIGAYETRCPCYNMVDVASMNRQSEGFSTQSHGIPATDRETKSSERL